MKENKQINEIKIFLFKGWAIICTKSYCMAITEEEMQAKYFDSID